MIQGVIASRLPLSRPPERRAPSDPLCVRQRLVTPPVLANRMPRCHQIAAGECCSSGVSPPAAHYHFAGGTMFHSPEFGQVQQLLVIVNQLSTTPMLLRVVPPGGLNCR